jgi:hypothetical protein
LGAGKGSDVAVTEDPTIATSIATFGVGDNSAASIRYDLPLPGAYSFQRIVPLDLARQVFADPAGTAGVPLTALGAVSMEGGGIRDINPARIQALYARTVAPGTRPSLRLAASFGPEVVNPSFPGDGQGAGQPNLLRLRNGDLPIDRTDDIEVQGLRRNRFLEAAANAVVEEVRARIDVPNAPPITTIEIPVPGLGQSVRQVTYDLTIAGLPQIAIVETWQVSAFLGDYGLGRTLQTFTLLPGERTTIAVETWRTDSATREDASSIFDSSDLAAQDRFSSALTVQSGSAFQDQGGWSASVGTKVSASADFFGLVSGSASVEAGFAANHQEARQTFDQSVSSTNREHTAQVNSSRRQAVSQSQSATTETGSSTSTVREIANTNLRRVLNFVFRELNQEYQTVTALRGVSVAFYNGHPGSAEIVPLSGMRGLLAKYVIEAERDRVARGILAAVCECIDADDTPQTMLQVGTRKAGMFDFQDVHLADDGTLDFQDPPLDPEYSWRIKPGPIGQAGKDHPVPGVVTGRDSLVLRTDNVVSEALLGQADALDTYASALQAVDLESRSADVDWRKAQVQRTTEALDIIDGIPNADKKVDAYKEILTEKPEIEVVPVAAVSNDHR